jgi:hypothetical protein
MRLEVGFGKHFNPPNLSMESARSQTVKRFMEGIIEQIYKYPRTLHIQGFKSKPGDEDLNTIPFTQIVNRPIIAEEKVDSVIAAISFDPSGNLRLQSRGHCLTDGPRERHFSLN